MCTFSDISVTLDISPWTFIHHPRHFLSSSCCRVTDFTRNKNQTVFLFKFFSQAHCKPEDFTQADPQWLSGNWDEEREEKLPQVGDLPPKSSGMEYLASEVTLGIGQSGFLGQWYAAVSL